MQDSNPFVASNKRVSDSRGRLSLQCTKRDRSADRRCEREAVAVLCTAVRVVATKKAHKKKTGKMPVFYIRLLNYAHKIPPSAQGIPTRDTFTKEVRCFLLYWC